VFILTRVRILAVTSLRTQAPYSKANRHTTLRIDLGWYLAEGREIGLH